MPRLRLDPLSPSGVSVALPRPVAARQSNGYVGESGVQDITAGTNVTIDKTDPKRPIISASGGGGGTGNVTGAASSTDNALVRFDTTTGKIIQNSNATLSDGGSLNLTGQASQAYSQGQLYYDTDNQALTFHNDDSNVSLQIGQEHWIRVKNVTGSTIANGSAVYITGANSGFPTVGLAQSNASATTVCVGLATESIANNATGYVTCVGLINGLDTSGFAAGATVYVSSTVAGGLVTTAPTAPNYRYRVGMVGTSSATVGTIHVTPSTASLGNGTANQIFGINAAGTAQEVKSVVGTTNLLTATHTANTITLNVGTNVYRSGGTDVAIADGGTGVSTLPSGLLKGAGTGAITAGVSGTDYQAPVSLTTTGTSGAATFVANTLNIPQYSAGGGGDASTNTATSVDGEAVLFSGTAGKTLKRSTLTGIIKQTSGVAAAATSGTDYAPGTSALGTGLVKSTTTTGALTIATGSDIPNIAESQVTNLVTDLAAKAPLASPTFTGTVTVPTPSNPTDASTKAYVDTAVTGLLDFKGSTDTSANPNYPSALKGDAYVVSVAGKIGGASGKSVDVGDMYLATADNAGGTEASVGTSWSVLEHNLVGAVLASNNLSDLASASTARTNLGLGNVDNTSNATERAAVRTLTNATISGASNTLSNIANASLTNSTVTVGSTSVALGATAATIAGVTLTTPVLGAATATSINKVAITAPATGSTLTIADGKTLTCSNSISLQGTDATIFTFPTASDTIAGLAAVQTITGAWTFNDSKLILAGATSGTTTLKSGAAAGTSVLTLPVATDTLVGKATTDTLTNKTLTSPVLTTPNLGTPSTLVLTNATGLVASTGTTATGTPSSTTYLRGDNTWATPAGGGSGDVVGPASATANALVVYNSTTGKLVKDSTIINAGARWLDTNSGTLILTGRSGMALGVSDGLGSSTTYLNMGANGLTYADFMGSTSGATRIQATAIAGSNALTLPAATDTLVGKATTDTLTNKTYDTAGTGNSFLINGVAANANQGTGAVVRATSPTLTTPALGVATATSVNKVAVTAPATSSTLTLVDGGTFVTAGAFSQTHTVTATTNSTYPAGTDTLLGRASADTITGVKTFGAAGNVGKLVVAGTTSGTTILNASAVASGTLTLPAATDTLVGKATTDTLTNKTINASQLVNSTVTADKLNTGATTAVVATSELTTSTTYVDLTTTTDTVTVTVGANGLAMVFLSAYMLNSIGTGENFMAFAISGASTVAASDTFSIMFQAFGNNAEERRSGSFLVTGLTPGSTTFKAKYKQAIAGNASFKDRRISVVPL